MGVREALAGRRVLVTGVTGFLGEALLERVLADLPQTSVAVLVRPSAGQTGHQRVQALLAGPAFATARAATPEGAAGLARRVEVIEGDLTHLPPLPPDIAAVVHCAGEVSFDPPIDEGFATNVSGAEAVYAAVAAAGAAPHIVHVSTAYVAGLRSGYVGEGPLTHDLDWRAERAAALRARTTAEDASRTPEALAACRRRAERDHHSAGAVAVATATEDTRRNLVRSRLVAAGTERARSLGWADCYTFTKALGERVAEEFATSLPLSVVRPSIIESALQRPYPGWIQGFKMAEPLILAYGRGELPDFPAAPDGLIDIVPVDLVVNAILATLAHPPPTGSPTYLHVASGARNPLLFRELYAHVREYFLAHPLPSRDGGSYAVPVWSFAGPGAAEAKLRTAERFAGTAERVLQALPPGARVRRAVVSLDRRTAALRFVRRYADLYRPYTQAALLFGDETTAALHARLSAADRADFGCDPAGFSWRHYLQEVHCPAVTGTLRVRRPPRPAPHLTPPAEGRALAVFDLDGTLVASTVLEAFLWLRLPEAPGAARAAELALLATRLPGYQRLERADRAEFIRAACRRYAGAEVAELARIVEELAGDELLARTCAAALRRVRAHRAVGHRTVLLTGALELLLRPLAPLFDEVVGARLEVVAGRCTGRLVAPPLVGDARAGWLERSLAEHRLDARASWAYGDSLTDLPMLRMVGHPVAVNPDVALLRYARRRRWPVVDWPVTPGVPRFAPPARRVAR